MTVQSAALALAMGFGLISGACSSDSASPSATGGSFNGGGTAGTSGSATSGGAGSGGGASCTNVAPCGGNAIGTWTVTSSCLKVSGELDLSSLGSCKSAPITGSLQVTGTWTANANGTSSDNTVTTGTEQITLGPACLVISSTPVSCEGAANLLKNLGYASLTCTTAGDGCACSGTIQQAGGLALLSPAPSKNSNYSTSASDLTITGDIGDTTYSYCTAGTQLTLTPHSTNPTVTGTVVLQSSSGGAGGAGGTSATAGSAGAGGTSQGGNLGAGGNAGAGGTNGTAGASSTPGPCDIYKTGGTPCVAAHSTVRALSQAYGGKLYQVRNVAGMTKDINAVTPGGAADAAGQDTFCMGTTCVITIIYDQSGKGNDLFSQDASSPVGGKDKPASATGESIKLGGSKAYSLYINPGNSYWADASKKGIPLGAEPEGMYMVASGTHFNSGCCFDYGNSELDRKADGAGAMDALNLSNTTAWGSGAGNGPWIMADLEYGLFAQNDNKKNPNDPSQTTPFVTAVLKNNGKTEFALRGGNAAAGNLTTYYKGGLPGGWSPMKKQGAIILGSGGDCCATNNNLSDGTFYEGCIVTGYPTDATEDAVQANIVAAMYSK